VAVHSFGVAFARFPNHIDDKDRENPPPPEGTVRGDDVE